MKFSSQNGTKKAAIGIGSILLLAASLVTVAATVTAQTTGCSDENRVDFGSQFFGSGDYGNHLLSVDAPTGGTELAPVAVSLPAGVYSVGAEATDGYTGRDTVTQPNEQWFAEFYSASGALLATTAPTGDVADLVEQGFWSGSLGEVTLAEDATSLVIKHAAPGSSSPNSVRAVCLSADFVADIPVEVLDSSIVVDFDSTNLDPSEVVIECAGAGSDSGTDTAVDLTFPTVEPGDECSVTWPEDHTCTVVVTPEGDIDVVEGGNSVVITFPEDVSVDVVVDIDCTIDCSDVDAVAAHDGSDCPLDCSDEAINSGVTAEADCMVECSDGSMVAEAADCPVECSDGSSAASAADCPVTCSDGSTAATAADCDDDDDDDEVITTEVQGQVIEAPVAQPQSADPTFTG